MMKLSEQFKTVTRFRKSVPVDVEGLAQALGIEVHSAYLSNGISGMLERSGDDEFRISLNASDSITRQRFTLAHEIGHYMLHRHLVGEGLDDDRAYRSTDVGKYHNTLIGPDEETEASKFAANLLMPEEAVTSMRKSLNDSVPEMSKAFGVSESAMAIRLGLTGE